EAGADVVAVTAGLDDPFAERLRLAEQVLRIRGLVGRHQYEASGGVLHRHLSDYAGGERVVAHRLDRVRLEERNVLVRGRVEDHARAVPLEDLAHLGAVAAVAEHGGDRLEVALPDELTLDRKQGCLRLLDEDEARGFDAGDLTAKLCADRAAGAG